MAGIENNPREQTQTEFRNDKVDVPNFSEQTAQLHEDNARAQNFRIAGNKEQQASQSDAARLIAGLGDYSSLSDLYDIKYADKPKTFNNQEITLGHNETSENNTGDKPMETQPSSTPEQQAAIKEALKSTPVQGNGNSLNKQEIQKTLDNVASLFPQKLGDFIKKLFAIFTGSTDKSTEGIKKDISKFIDNSENKAKLESYGPKITDAEKGGIQLQFAEGAKITGEKTTQKSNDAKDETKPSKIDIKDGKIILADGTQITKVDEEGDGKISLTLKNGDGSTEKYTVENLTKADSSPSEKASKSGV